MEETVKLTDMYRHYGGNC